MTTALFRSTPSALTFRSRFRRKSRPSLKLRRCLSRRKRLAICSMQLWKKKRKRLRGKQHETPTRHPRLHRCDRDSGDAVRSGARMSDTLKSDAAREIESMSNDHADVDKTDAPRT